MAMNNAALVTIANEFLDSSDESDSESNINELLLNATRGKRPRLQNYIDNDQKFKSNFRVTKEKIAKRFQARNNNKPIFKEKASVQFLDAESNKIYTCFLSPEDAQRVSKDMVFAQHLFNGLIREKNVKINNNNEGDLHLEGKTQVHDNVLDNTESSQVSRGGMSWTHEQTLLLINLYRQEYMKMGSGKILLRKLWQLVAQRMKEKGHDIPATKCSIKMDALKRQYKKVINRNRQSGNNLITYKYFDELDEIFRKQPWAKPITVASSELQDSMFENIDERNSFPGSKCNRNIILEEILKERKNKAAKTEEYRNEKLCLMKELIETLKKSTKGSKDEMRADRLVGRSTSAVSINARDVVSHRCNYRLLLTKPK